MFGFYDVLTGSGFPASFQSIEIGAISYRVKRPGHESDGSSPPDVEIKNDSSCTSATAYLVYDVLTGSGAQPVSNPLRWALFPIG